MDMRNLVLVGMVVFVSTSPSRAQTSVPETLAGICSTMYTGALQRVQSDQQLSVTIETMKRHTCNASNFNLDAGFDSNTKTIISGVPVVSRFLGNLNINSNKQFCEAVNQGKINIGQNDSFSVEPVVAAMENANECIRIAAGSGIAITHSSPDVSQVLFSARFGAVDGRTFKFSGLTSGGFQCVAPHTDGTGADNVGPSTITRTNNFGILCTRPGKKISPDSEDLEYTQGSIGLTTSDGNVYTVIVPGDTLYGLQSRKSAKSKLDQSTAELNNSLKIRDSLSRRMLSSKQVRFYFYHTHIGPGPGERFTCGDWNSGRPIEIAKARVCPNGILIDQQHSEGPGRDCGFNSYAAICLPD